MEIIRYEIQHGDTLQSIAEKYEITVKNLVDSHNQNCGLTNLIIGDNIPIHLKYIFLEIDPSRHFRISNIDFTKRVRYRCELNNVITIDGKPNFSAQTKTEYLLSSKKQNDDILFMLRLEDYVNSIQPQEMEAAFHLIREIEMIRDNVVYTQNEDGEINNIINKDELSKKWQEFILHKAAEVPFYNEMKARDPDTIRDFIENGNKEFSDSKELSKVLAKNMLYHILLKSNMKNGDQFSILQQSQLFPNILLKINVSRTIVSDQANTVTYRLTGTLDENQLDQDKIMRLYEEMYQPIIKYSFTKFNYIYRITYTVEKASKLLTDATASIKEQVKNNYESITKFELRSVEI
ncbi:LysM domain-containing protein [uncultured Chryseobacterium sp.]|uniref:LysM peptidoglycan-binding domain-containing protein n=1 Tax=uncultured Chryseobacterium sp. TaxID=259322 RepID=UPI0025E835AE|nr:LysM domain-containing protein [uncultured Chryseobacterium sp.]